MPRTIDLTKTFSSVPGAIVTPVAGATPQAAAVSTAFANPLAVLVKDAGGNPVQNAIVTYNPPVGGGASATLSSLTAATNRDGIASVTATANANPGGFSFQASVGGGAQSASFVLTNT